MDDLDHSIHIAENDWTSFYEDSEECGLQQPLLACPDHASLSDSEDSRNSSPVLITGPEAHSDKSEGISGSWCVEEVQSDLSISRRDRGEEDRETPLSSEIGLDCPEGRSANTEEVHGTAAETTNCDVTEKIHAQSSSREAAELRGDNGNQTESDICELIPVQEADPLSLNQAESDVNEPQSADRAESEDVSRRAERERWFVTVNTNPARQRLRVPSGKKKRRQKKSRRESKMCRTNKQNFLEIGSTLEIDTGNNEPDISNRCPTAGENKAISDLSPMSSTSEEEDNSSDKPFISMSLPLRDIFPLRGTFIPKGPKRFDSLESEEYLSTHSYESESYLSAAESMDEPPSPPLQSPVSLTKNSPLLNLMENTICDDKQVTANSQLSLNDSTHSDPTAANSEGHGSPDAGPMQTLPSVQQSVNKMPDDHAACVNDSRSMVPCMSSDTAGLQKHEINLSTSACSSGDQLSPLTVPDLTVTPCAAVDSPEAYAAAAGNTRPVFAISAFWDEMEKLTINDILQLRMGKSPTPRETQEPATPDFGDFKTIPCSLVETVGHNLSTGGLMDTSDTADSDYFTQVDESKPHRSSCEFSTSDFEEEYWQFLGASRNQSPDTLSESQQETLESSLLDEEDSTCSEGKETPVPSVDFFEDQDYSAITSKDPECPRQIIKSKSVQNVPALNMEDLSLQLNDSSLVHSSCPPLEEDIVLEASDILGTSISAPFLSDTNVLDGLTEIPFFEVFQHLLTNQSKRESCVTIFHPEISLTPEFNPTTGDQKSFLSLHDSQWSNQNPIPIFSCSHPTVRELTFPDPDFVFLSSKSNEDNDVPPIRVVSHSLILGRTFGSGFPSLLSIKKIPFQNKGSIWSGSTSPWVFPVEAVNKHIEEEGSPLTVLEEGSVPISLAHLFGEPAIQHGVLGTIQTSRREGIFSALKQSDMCLVCIAFASWVLRSSDPEAADTWKAALLANVSALSAIQYLRQYVKKNPSQDDP